MSFYMPRPESGFLCCVPKGKELLLADREKASPNNPLGLRGELGSGFTSPPTEPLPSIGSRC